MDIDSEREFNKVSLIGFCRETWILYRKKILVCVYIYA